MLAVMVRLRLLQVIDFNNSEYGSTHVDDYWASTLGEPQNLELGHQVTEDFDLHRSSFSFAVPRSIASPGENRPQLQPFGRPRSQHSPPCKLQLASPKFRPRFNSLKRLCFGEPPTVSKRTLANQAITKALHFSRVTLV